MKDEDIPSEAIDGSILALARLGKKTAHPSARLFALAVIEARREGVTWDGLHMALVTARTAMDAVSHPPDDE